MGKQENFRKQLGSVKRVWYYKLHDGTHQYTSYKWRSVQLLITCMLTYLFSVQGSYYFAEFIFPDFSRQNE